MPPAISDGEEGSDVDFDAPPPATKSSSRGKRAAMYKDDPLKDEEEEDDALPVTSDVKDTEVDEDEGEDEGEDDGEEAEDIYVVEKILEHQIDKKTGEPLFKVKWEGYDEIKDQTWEPEENLIDASIVFNEYLERIGGREQLFAESNTAVKTKKRGRPSSGTQTGGKRARKNGTHPADSEPPLAARAATWKPPPGSWEEHIATLDACEDEETGRLMVYLTWKNGQKTQHETSVIYARCPQKMLQFYENHVRIIKRDPDADSVASN